MKRVFSTFLISFLLLIGTSIFLTPSAGYSFWYGDQITEHVNETTAQGLHGYILENILTDDFLQSLRGVDNNPDEITGVRIYDPRKSWNGYTLLSY